MAYVLAINPGSTSTKIGVFQGERPILSKTIRHTQEELSGYCDIVSQKDFRTELILKTLQEAEISLEEICGIIAIGGLIRPGDAGVYKVNDGMLQDLREARYNEHAANLGALIAHTLSEKIGSSDCYVADAITADELMPVARVSGMPEITRLGRTHTLNQKSIARMCARDLGLQYDKANFVVAHLGGGISVAAHCQGRMVDTNSARGEGPFCIDRTGGLNAFTLAQMCYSGKYSKEQMLKKINGEGGVVAYLNTRDFREVVSRRAKKDQKASEVFDAMVYQISKEIAAMTIPLKGNIDGIVLTGGMANSTELTDAIREYVAYLGKVYVYPGEQELEALAGYLNEIQAGVLVPMEYEREA